MGGTGRYPAAPLLREHAMNTQTDIPGSDAYNGNARPLHQRLLPGATSMIRLDHTHVLTTFHRYRADIPTSRKAGLAGVICTALEIHATLEEEIFYPAMRAVADDEVLQKSVPEHMEMRRLIGELRGMSPTDVGYDQTVLALMRDVIHHVADEETVLLPEAERLLSRERLRELGSQMTRRRMQLAGPQATQIARDMARGMPYATAAVGAIAALVLGRLVRSARR
jgi:hypothetical protein